MWCAVWLSDPDPGSGRYEDSGRFEELLPLLSCATLAGMLADCAAFQAQASFILAAVYKIRPDYTPANAGHDFWLTRNGHGSGFWSRDNLPETAATFLTDKARGFGEAHLDELDAAEEDAS